LVMPQPEKYSAFVREATGFVKQITPLDAVLAVFAAVNIPLGLLTYTSGPYLFPGSDLVWGTILTTILSIPLAVMYTLYGRAMPRSGGDYVFVSRALHPVLGFVENFGLIFWSLFFIGFAANFVTTLALSPSLLIIGVVTSNPGLVNLGNTLSQPLNVVIIGLVLIVIFTLVMIQGVRSTFIIVDVLMVLVFIGVFLSFGLLMTSSNANFAASFGRYAQYDTILSAAHIAGYSPISSNSLLATLGIMPLVYLTTGFANTTTYYGGEVRAVKSAMFYSQLLVTILSGAILTVFAFFAVRVFGYDFLGCMSYLQANGSSVYPFTVPPSVNLFLSMLTDNQALLWLLAASFVAALLAPILPVLMAVSRSIFAWSFDRIIPTKFANVSERFHTPVFAILAMNSIWAVTLVIYTYGPPFFITLLAGATLAENISLIIIAVTAMVCPFRTQLFRQSEENLKVFRIPIMSIAGTLSLGFLVLLTYFLLVNPLYGANNVTVYAGTIAVFAIAVVIYAVSYYSRKSAGINLSLAFKELPPE